ncbi:ATP-binding protein [Enterococcus italicus]
MIEFEDEILSLLHSKSEGGYWDFKRSWHEDDASLLHDIICLANNIENRDCYLIIGVDEKNNFEFYPLNDDHNRKNSNELTIFLRDKKFFGGIRPSISLQTITVEGYEIDVLTVKNDTHTPYYLTEDYYSKNKNLKKPKVVLKQNIYTRINDTNTPINRTADIDKIEYLWRKRFGIYLSIEEKMQLYLSDVKNWVYDDERGMFYYRMEPLFTIELKRLDYDEQKLQSKRSEFYDQLMLDKGEGDTWEEFEIKYANVTIYSHWVDYLDGGRYMIAIPQCEIISNNSMEVGDMYMYYYDLSNIQGLVNKIFVNYYPGEGWNTLKHYLEDFLIKFNSKIEVENFVKFMNTNISLLTNDELYPKEVLEGKDGMEESYVNYYIGAKKIKWVYEKRYLNRETVI